MPYISPWYKEAYLMLDLALDCLPRDCTDKKLIRAVARECYGFGQRKAWPYKQYCKAKRLVLWQKFPRLFPAPPTRRRRADIPVSDVAGQLPLFGESQ